MTPSEKQIYDEEGEVLHAYQDSLGYWTIGVGHLIDKRKGGAISIAASRFILAEDIAAKTAQLVDALPWTATLDEARFAALLNMAFQLGVAGVLKFPKMLAALRRGDGDEVRRQALERNTLLDEDEWSEQTPARAKRVAEQLATGVWQWKK